MPKRMKTDHILEPLRGLAVPIKDLNQDPANVRQHDRKNLDAIKASFQKFGQRVPIVVQRQGMVVRAGNGRLEVARELKWDCMAAVIVDEGDVEATAYALADNRSGELADWDTDGLAGMLRSLRSEEFDLGALGWSDSEIASLLKEEESPPPPEEKGGSNESLIRLTKEQKEVIDKAADVIRDEFEDGRMPVGRCLRVICDRFLDRPID